MENGRLRKRPQLTPEEQWEIFLEVTSQEISQADAARKYDVDVSVIIWLRALTKDATLAAFASAKPGRPASVQDVEIEFSRSGKRPAVGGAEEDGGRVDVALGKAALGLSAQSPRA
jgi:hypothetical protein